MLAQPNLLRKRRALDPAQEIHHVWDAERFQKALGYTDMLFCNRNELATALRYAGKQSPEELLDAYRGMQVIVNTLGGQGARIYGRNEVLDVPAARVGWRSHRGRGRLPGRFLRRAVSGHGLVGVRGPRLRCRLLRGVLAGLLDRHPGLGHGGGEGEVTAAIGISGHHPKVRYARLEQNYNK